MEKERISELTDNFMEELERFYDWNDHRDYSAEGNSSQGITNKGILDLIKDFSEIKGRMKIVVKLLKETK